MSGISECQNKLITMANDKGYLTFDDIMDVSDEYALSIVELDRLNEALNLRGVIIYESAPEIEQKETTIEDHSRVDYAAIYSEIISLSEGTADLVNWVKNLPTPQRGEVVLLTKQLQEGNDHARERLIALYARNVLKVALAMSKIFCLDIADAISAGFVGLLIAVDKYDPNGFSSFISYASLWIQQNIQRECIPLRMEYYYPTHYLNKMMEAVQRYKHCFEENELLEKEFNREDTLRFFEQECVDEEQTYKLLEEFYNQVCGKICLDQEISNEELRRISREFNIVLLQLDRNIGSCVSEYIIDTESKELLEIVMEKILKDYIIGILDTLTEREEKVIRLRFGLDDDIFRTYEAVGQEFNVTRERIRQIEVKALRKLKHPSRSKILRDFWI